MEELVEEGRREMEECDRVKGKVERALREIEEGGRDGGGGGGGGGVGSGGKGLDAGNSMVHDKGRQDDAKRLWKMMNDIDIEAN